MSASTYYDKRGRLGACLILEESSGYSTSLTVRTVAWNRQPAHASLVFASHAADRVLTPAPEAYMHLAPSELEECLRRAV